MCKNKKCAKYDELYIFEKPLVRRIQICKSIRKNNFQKLNVYSRKPENVQIPFKGICVKIYEKFLLFVKGFLMSYKMSKTIDWKYV